MALNSDTTKLPTDTVVVDVDGRTTAEPFDYAKRAQWLRAAVLGANDGLVSTASLMMGVGAVKSDARAMVLSGLAGLVAGACSMAIGEFVSVYSQYDIEVAQMEREGKAAGAGAAGGEEEKLPSPLQAAVASGLAFSVGAMVPLLAAGFISSYKVRVGVIAAAVSITLAVFGSVGAVLGNTPVGRSCGRVVVGGWMAMAVTFGMMKLFGSRGL
ncbi:vacuolar iron transporter-like protein 5 [Iris pallida]|uniref:Vacuolar iron transporter n=1 Tax=Iris pallida TaxID=29817 RepID=A0AAX6EGW6_IRIPA|nr:vacuolar iron transporter-like protein 5 [Iris pallida]